MALKKSIRKIVLSMVKPFPPLRRLARAAIITYRKQVYKTWQKQTEIDSKLIVFESFMGRNLADSPKAILEEMLDDPWFFDFKFIIALKEPVAMKAKNLPRRVKVVIKGSPEYYRAFATAKIWIANSRLPEYLTPTSEQIYIQTWHGTTLKKLGYDIAQGKNAMNTKRELREKYDAETKRFSVLVSPSPYMTKIYQTMFNLPKFHKENVVWELGYPRNDRLAQPSQAEIRRLKSIYKIPADKKVILYAPTWRDDQHKAGLGYTFFNYPDLDRLMQVLGDDYVVLFRAHYFIANQFDFAKYKGRVINVGEVNDINDLYLISDILITDYSSTFFDFAMLNRPIVFYMPDLDYYENTLRGFYLKIAELPGKITKNTSELIDSLKELERNQPSVDFRMFNERFNPLEDGNSSKRVVGEIRRLYG